MSILLPLFLSLTFTFLPCLSMKNQRRINIFLSLADSVLFIRILVGFVFLLGVGANNLHAQEIDKIRVIILTDIEADPDDTQSLVRLFVYSNQLDIKGIVATTSCWMKNEIHPNSIRKVINAYGEVRENLLLHEQGFPTAKALLDVVKSGQPIYGITGVGNGLDTEGSKLIIQELESDDPRPLWISVWGGVNTLAQALQTISATKSEEEADRLIAKLRVYTISDQDDSGIWIRNTFPELFYIVTPGDDYGSATWTGINSKIDGISNAEISNEWISAHIQQNHGPLGAQYPDVAWGMEGDTPAFLGLLINGINSPDHPQWGGWGGRYELYQPEFLPQKNSAKSGVPWQPETRKIWTNATDEYSPYVANAFGRSVKKDSTVYKGDKVGLWRWREDFQNDFAARIDWTCKPFEEANHPPVAVLLNPEVLTVKSGEPYTLDASNSYDPDGDNLSMLWFPYPEAGTYEGEIQVSQPENAHRYHGTAPKVDKEETIHIILRLTDKGNPQLSRYKRVVLKVIP